MAGPSQDGESLDFYKIDFAPTSFTDPMLPEEFVRRSNIAPGDVMTVETYLDTFTFTIEKVDGRLMLHRRTWEQCVGQHDIGDKWFLLFTHQSNMHFKLSMFDPSACNIENKFVHSDSEDISESEQLSEALRDNLHVDDGRKLFSVQIPHSSAYNYHSARLGRLSIPAEAWSKYQLLHFNKAELRVPANSSDKWVVELKWVSKSRGSDQGTFALKEAWVKFAKDNKIKAPNMCHFEIMEEEGNTVKMNVAIDNN